MDARLAVLVVGALVAAAALGWGRLVARAAGRDVEAPLAIAWGAAALVALAGAAIALHAYTRAMQWTLVGSGAALALADAVLARRKPSPRGFAGWAGFSLWALVLALALLHTLGAAGDVTARPFDDDGNLVAQIARLADTGALSDPLGYARGAQLGGGVALQALGALAGSAAFARLTDLGLGFALLLALVASRSRNAEPILTALALLAAAAFAPSLADATPIWLPAALLVALHATARDGLDDDRPRAALPTGLVAGALVALHVAFAPLALVALLAAWQPQRGRGLARAAVLLAAALAPLAGLYAARAAARATVPHAARALLTASPLASPAAGTALLLAAAALAAILLARAKRDAALLVAAAVTCLLLYEARDARGRARWATRATDLVESVAYLSQTPRTAPDPYGALLATAPRGATVAVYVSRPELLDYARHRILDLRTPRAARLRRHAFAPHASPLAALLTAARADFLLVEADDERLARAQADPAYAQLCDPPLAPALCDDDLEALARAHPIAAARAGVRLIDLRGAR